jgi:hypothetical protein
MSEPTQAQVKEAIKALRLDVQNADPDDGGIVDDVVAKNIEIVCAAAERSLAPATPTDEQAPVWRRIVKRMTKVFEEVALQEIMQEQADKAAAPPATPTEQFELGRVEGIDNACEAFKLHVEDYPNWDCSGDCRYGKILKPLIEKAATPPATQTGDVRKPSARQIVFNWMMGEDWLERPDGWWGTADGVAKVDELLAALASAAPTPEPTGKCHGCEEGWPYSKIEPNKHIRRTLHARRTAGQKGEKGK